MDISIEIVIQSHLSDSIVEINNNYPESAINRIQFVKKLLNLRSTGKIGHRIDDEMLEQLWIETIKR
jgi:hypothetical protein